MNNNKRYLTILTKSHYFTLLTNNEYSHRFSPIKIQFSIFTLFHFPKHPLTFKYSPSSLLMGETTTTTTTSETCSSRHLSRLMKSCFPNANDTSPSIIINHTTTKTHRKITTIHSLPDDLIIDILTRLPLSSLPSISSVCRRWICLVDSHFFFNIRRRIGLIFPTIFAFSFNNNNNSYCVSIFRPLVDLSWNNILPANNNNDDGFVFNFNFNFSSHFDLSHARFIPFGRKIFIIGRSGSVVFDPWTGSVQARSGSVYPRKRFAAAEVEGRIYVAGGSATVSCVEEYDPASDEWRVVAHGPRKRYGCVGVGLDGVFYIIGGLKVGGVCDSRAIAGADARVYASSMDLYVVAARGWLRSRAVPGGGCVVAACGAHGHVYVLASHAVELSFWRFNGTRKNGGGFGEWWRVRGPPLPAQARLDGTVRFTCVGVEDKVVLIQVMGSIDDLLRRSGRNVRGCNAGVVLIFDCVTEEWCRGPDLPHLLHRAACVSLQS